MMQLYSSFPHGAAGWGLLLLRILSGSGLAEQSYEALYHLLAAPESKLGPLGQIALISVLLASALILVGFWTFLAASLAPLAVFAAYGLGFVHPAAVLFAALSVVVALLGPGSLSLDARLFGWRQIRFSRLPNTQPKEK